jgi:uncharacterized membrane protein (TIGR02234 family)
VTGGHLTDGPVDGAPVTGGPVTGGPVTGGPVTGGPVTGGPATARAAGPEPLPPAAPRAGSAAREYLLVLGLAAAGAGLVFLSARQPWARVVTAAAAPLPSSSVPVTGQDLVPVAGALAVASLAALAAVIATRGLARRLVGTLLAAAGALTVLAVTAHLGTAAVLAAAHGTAVSQAGSVTAGGGPGGTAGGGPAGAVPGGAPGVGTAAHIVMAGFPWRPLAAVGALAVLAAGIVVAWRGPRWPAMSSRYERTGGGKPQPVADTASLWESLNRGVDPTEPGPGGRPLGS